MDIELGFDSPRSSIGQYENDSFVDDASCADSESPLFVQPSCPLQDVPERQVVCGLQRQGSPLRELSPDRRLACGDGCIPSELDGKVTKPGKRLGTGAFRLSCQRVLLTYSRVPQGFCVDSCRDLIELLGPSSYRIGKERHQDGNVHYHCYVDFGRRFETENARRFDVEGHHPNILCIRRTPECAWDYAGKDGDVIHENGLRPTPSRSKRCREEDWAIIRSAPTRDEFFEKGYELATRDFILFGSSCALYADQRYNPKKPCYDRPDGLSISWESIPEVRRFVVESLRDPNDIIPNKTQEELDLIRSAPSGERVKSLIIYGDTRLGKTEMIRSVAKHVYFGGMFDLQEFSDNPDVAFALFDDIDDVAFVPLYKFWLGAQKEFVTTDKYKHKVRINWGRPSVWVANKSLLDYRDKRGNSSVDVDWLFENCFIQCVENKIVAFN